MKDTGGIRIEATYLALFILLRGRDSPVRIIFLSTCLVSHLEVAIQSVCSSPKLNEHDTRIATSQSLIQ